MSEDKSTILVLTDMSLKIGTILERIEENNTSTIKIQDGVKELQELLNHPTDGVRAHVDRLLRWKKVMNKVGWLLFSILTAGIIGGILV